MNLFLKAAGAKFLQIFKMLLPYLAIGLVLLAVRNFAVDYSRINGTSMAPTLQDRQVVLVNKLDKQPKRGEVILFDATGVDPRAPKGDMANGHITYIKRVIGVAGDTVEKRGNKLFVNGKEVRQDYLKYGNSKYKEESVDIWDQIKSSEQRGEGSGTSFAEDWTLKSLSESGLWNEASQNTVKVPKGHYFVMGDHRSSSNDSRMFGYVPAKNIIGTVNLPEFWLSHKTNNFMNEEKNHFFK